MSPQDEITGTWPKSAEGPRPLVLVAEDDWDAQQLYRELLELRGFRVLIASDGREALELGLTSAIDAAIVDLMLPRISGYDVAAELRAKHARLPIFVITARSDPGAHGLARAAGCDRVFVKPVDHRALARALRTTIASRRGKPPE
jgi:DNA-binding response OmpR family regulator